ncbi:di-trans,poly-cis-decaprenylcistransferase [Salipiger sp. HF18]|uniref:polyprenyl diphosphate synthase n=1 Tax=Salipiger sp. HF18 TaxID=2721557 RepID=UPI00142D57C0|nr:polyprenyl diphosphate synthase [Salipiger sp. HF18]NIY98486.1 di-trans,poly-cis-decaprenylcistransferase [Salipiger sp. HF18]
MPKPIREGNGPRHVAIIMDGNGRWAQRRGRPRLFGHHAGAKRVREIVEACPDLGVRYVTIFAFSTENWRRTQSEVAGLMSLFRVRLDKKLVSLMDELELMTSGCTGVNLTIAINYGGRDEVARATRRLAQDVAAGKLDPDAVNEETLPKYLDTCVLPDPDLVIRTSGEARISNFLLWQSAYAEYEFIDTLWPDFCAEEFGRLVTAYGNRERRYGGVKA